MGTQRSSVPGCPQHPHAFLDWSSPCPPCQALERAQAAPTLRSESLWYARRGTRGEGYLQRTVPMTTSRQRQQPVREMREARGLWTRRAWAPTPGRTRWGTAEGMHLWFLLPRLGSACSILFLAAWDRQAWHCWRWAAALQLVCTVGKWLSACRVVPSASSRRGKDGDSISCPVPQGACT